MDYKTIDIRDMKEMGDELKKAIEDAVAATQSVIIRELPDTLVMTKAQYDHLNDDPEMHGFYKDKNRIYVTNLNAMDVVVK